MNEPSSAGPSAESSGGTHASILSGMRLSKDDARRKESRARFFDKYWQLFFVFFKRKRLRDHDAEDLAGDLIVKLLQRMGTFERDPSKSFRSFLYFYCVFILSSRFFAVVSGYVFSSDRAALLRCVAGVA